MLLIADGGSTKTNWVAIDDSGQKLTFDSEGYNPYFVDSAYISQSLSAILPPDFNADSVENIYFYGAGVQNEDKAVVLKSAFEGVFSNADSFVGHDLLASARALLGFNSGFAAILGTGTNSCLYDGTTITHHIDSGAHILGDEGSGFYMGKRILIDFLRGAMPEVLLQKFKARYQLDSDLVHEAVYSQPLANRYCASFTRFIAEDYREHDYSMNLITNSFNDFFKNIVSLYPGYSNHTFNCVGSIGYVFKDVLQEVATSWDMPTGNIIKSPIEGLVAYHTTEVASKSA